MAVLKRYEEIPGPKSPALIGNALQIGKRQPWLRFEAWAQEYGGLVRFKILKGDCLLVNDPAYIEEVVRDQFDCFHKTGQLKPLKPLLTTSVFIASHEDWPKRRRQHPFEQIDLQEYFAGVLAPMRAHARRRVAELATSRRPVRIHEEMEKLTFEMFAIALLNDPLDEMWRREEGQLVNIGARRVKAVVLPRPSRTLLKLRDRWFGRLRARIEARLSTQHDGADLLDTMLRLGTPEDLEHFTTEFGTIFFGGVGAVSTTFTALLRSLSLHDRARDALVKGVTAFCSSFGGDYTLDNLDSFDLLRWTVDESLRLEASVPFFLRIAAVNGARIGGYAVPRGVKVFISPWVLHRTAEYWPDPVRFDPTRFEHGPAPYTFIPFGAGPRECVGKLFASFCTRLAFATFFERHRPRVDTNAPYARLLSAGNYIPSGPVWGRFEIADG